MLDVYYIYKVFSPVYGYKLNKTGKKHPTLGNGLQSLLKDEK